MTTKDAKFHEPKLAPKIPAYIPAILMDHRDDYAGIYDSCGG